MLDGSAYAMSSDSQLWYVRGSQAVRVTVISATSGKLPDFFEITPVVDGSAYLAASLGDGGLWHLRGEHAEKVVEVSSLTSSDGGVKISDRAFYALYLSEHKKRKEAEYRADNPSEFAPEPPEDDPF